ncbi:MAG: hypothetical protein LAP38_20215 [Acidobacteriia bacterium]|nr:hypothetical protein [Terriglobia bacterium]
MAEWSQPSSLLRRALPILTVIIGVAVLYDGWIFYSRWSSARKLEQERARAEAERASRTIKLLGGDQLKILGFYAAPAVVQRGQATSICFGVTGAARVRIEPPIVEDLHPSLSRCFQVAPRNDTEYKLTAEDAAGHTMTQSMVVRIAR